ncbi:mitochondrial metal transporter [Microbotryomycetes sp. JL201]|nr:mitochondrial metal transporter [Microbotryomycetes sp. JL201]
MSTSSVHKNGTARKRRSTAASNDVDVHGERRSLSPASRQSLFHSHSHSHGGSGSHSHSHSHSHSQDDAAQLMAAFSAKGSDPGSRITIIGLLSNVGLTVTKGVAGFVLGSAALLADAAHSGSDLLADVVTLTTYNMSRRPVSLTHPYGYGKYESLGSAVVSFLLLGTALGIGLHSYHLLLTTLATMPGMNPEFLASLDLFPHSFGHHDHGAEVTDPAAAETVDPRAMWFAAGSIVPILFTALKVAKEQHSNVLLANAFHHRSDAFGSLVAVGAIGGAWLGFPVLDPLGGLLVSGMILKQGAEVGLTSLKELTDQVTDPTIAPQVHALLATLRDPSLAPLEPYEQDSADSISTPSTPRLDARFNSPPAAHTRSHSHTPRQKQPSTNGDVTDSDTLPILSIPSIRIFQSGPSMLIDIQLTLPLSMTLEQFAKIQTRIQDECRQKFGYKRVREVVVRFLRPQDE